MQEQITLHNGRIPNSVWSVFPRIFSLKWFLGTALCWESPIPSQMPHPAWKIGIMNSCNIRTQSTDYKQNILRWEFVFKFSSVRFSYLLKLCRRSLFFQFYPYFSLLLPSDVAYSSVYRQETEQSLTSLYCFPWILNLPVYVSLRPDCG